MQNYKDLITDVVTNGELRKTRTGNTISVWDRKLSFDLSKGFPAITSRKMPWKAIVGELIWFLSKSQSVADLRKYTFGDVNADRWTIWTDDAERWNKSKGNSDLDFVGNLYPTQWREFNNNEAVDQIARLVDRLKNNPLERDHIVMAWNPEAIHNDSMALKPCHIGFQCYVTGDNKLNLKWTQRSWDLFLGGPANIASYALLTHIIAKLTGLEVGTLSVEVGDAHVYGIHLDAVKQYLERETYDAPTLVMPEFDSIDEILNYTADDFILDNYKHGAVISAQLSVGV